METCCDAVTIKTMKIRRPRAVGESRRDYMSMEQQLWSFIPLMKSVTAAANGNETDALVAKSFIRGMKNRGENLEDLADCMEEILGGSRRIENIEALDPLSAAVVETTLRSIEDPEHLKEMEREMETAAAEEESAGEADAAGVADDVAGARWDDPSLDPGAAVDPGDQAAGEGEDLPEQIRQIAEVVTQGANNPGLQPQMEPVLTMMEGQGMGALSHAIRRIWNGERDASVLTADMDEVSRSIVTTVLAELEKTESGGAPGGDEALSQLQRLVSVLAEATKKPELQPRLETVLTGISQQGGEKLVSVIRRVWTGERNAADLTDGMEETERTIVYLLLNELAGDTADAGTSAGEPFAAADAPEAPGKEPPVDIDAGTGDPAKGAGEADPAAHVQQLVSVLAAPVNNPALRPQVEPILDQLAGDGMEGLSGAIRRIWDGERDPAALTSDQGEIEQLIIRGVLAETGEVPKKGDAMGGKTSNGAGAVPDEIKQLITVLAAAAGNPALRPQLEPIVNQMENEGMAPLAASIRSIWNGERDEAVLTAGVDEGGVVLLKAVLAEL